MKTEKTKKINRKKVGFLLLAAFLCLLLCTGCAGIRFHNENGSAGTERHSPKDVRSVPDKAEAKQKKGEMFDTGTFSICVADGWRADMAISKMPRQARIPKIIVSPSNLLLFPADKTDGEEKLEGPHIRIVYNDSTVEQARMQELLDSYEQSEMPPVMLNDVTCDAFLADIRGVEYQVITYPQEDGRFYIYIATRVDGKKTGVTWRNKEIKEMLESLLADKEL